MCGLVGAFRADKGNFIKSTQFITQGLFLSVLRGYSGTGVGLIDDKFTPDFVKSRLDAPNFVQTKQYAWVENNAHKSRVIMGHTRAPTGGTSTNDNAHPFWYWKQDDHEDSVILTHNGHINNYHSLTPAGFKHEVDSAHVTHSILVDGALPTLKKMTGYYVLVWFSQKDKKLHIARNNSNRDLFLAMSPNKDVIYYASEKEILQFLLDRIEIPYLNKGTPEAFQQLDDLKMYSWDLTKPTLEEPEITVYEEKKISYMATGGTAGTGGSTTRTSANPTRGDRIFADCTGSVLTLYGNNTDFGYMIGVRRMDKGTVRIDGVHKKDWDEKWKFIRGYVPVSLNHSVSKTVSGVTTYEYKGIIEVKEANSDVARFLPRNIQPPKHQGASSQEATTTKAGETISVEIETYPSKKSLETKSLADDSPQLVPGPNNTTISLKQWREISKMGCVGCHGTIIEGLDFGKVDWYAWGRCPEDKPEDTEWQMICPVCVRDPNKMQNITG